MPETTALGVAMAAGFALGIWNLDTDGAVFMLPLFLF